MSDNRASSPGSERIRRGGLTLRNLKTFSSFKNPVYRIYYGGMLGHMVAMNMQMLARSLLVYRLTNSATILAAMSFAGSIPMLILSLFGGVIADRVNKRKVLILGQAGAALVGLGMAISLSMGYLSEDNPGSIWILIASSLLQGVIMGLMMPSRQSIINEIVTADELMNAIALNNMGMNALQIIAPAITGFLVDAAGFEASFYAMTAMEAMGMIFFIFMPATGTVPMGKSGAIDNIRKGFSYLRKEPPVLMILLFSLVVVVLGMPYSQLLPIFTEDILDVGASGMGLLLSVTGIGAIICSVVLASLPNRKRGIMLIGSGILLGVSLIVFSFSNSMPLSLAIIIFVGIGQTGRMTLSNTLIQYYVDPAYLGRVMSIYMMQFGLNSFGTFLAGVLSDIIGVQWAVGSFAIALLVFSLLSPLLFKRIVKME